METSYKILGSDGREYGPVDLNQIKAWITEGRVTQETQIWRSDQSNWLPASQFSELAWSPSPPSIPPAANVNAAKTILERRIKAGAGWFFWIAALSLVNSVIAVTGGNWRLIIGLGVTQIIDAFAHQFGSNGTVVVLVLDALVAGIFVLFGIFAAKRHAWAFIIGMVLYAIDGLLFLLVMDWLSIAFHAFALYCIFGGLRAHFTLRKLEGN